MSVITNCYTPEGFFATDPGAEPALNLQASSLSAWTAMVLETAEAGGRIHSVFPRAVNLVDAEGRLICISSLGGGAVPFGLLLPAHGVVRMAMHGLRASMQVVLSRTGVHIPEAGLQIDLRTAEVLTPQRALGDAIPPGEARLESLLRLLNRRNGSEKRGFTVESFAEYRPDTGRRSGRDPFLEALMKRLRASLDAQKRGEPEEASTELLGMIGLGSGLTPAGDDLLVGIMVALDACRLSPRAAPLYRHLARGLYRFSGEGTTDVAHAYLIHAVQGRFAERLIAVRDAVLRGVEDADLEKALDWLLSFGAASGGETALGLLTGFYLIDQTSLRPEAIAAASHSD